MPSVRLRLIYRHLGTQSCFYLRSSVAEPLAENRVGKRAAERTEEVKRGARTDEVQRYDVARVEWVVC